MRDFKDSLLAGIAAARVAENNRSEINSVLDNLNRQVKEISQNKAIFSRGRFVRRQESNAAQAFVNLAQQLAMSHASKTYEGLGIYDSEGKNGIVIAEWTEDDSGYPCIVSCGGEKLVCSNKTELENALSYVLREVKTGEAILTQIERFDKKEKPWEADPV
ncbi:hypothetical protein ACX3OY_06580 [Citrobacter farmeri]|nr:hypothetical protein [Citrobacter farmeri]